MHGIGGLDFERAKPFEWPGAGCDGVESGDAVLPIRVRNATWTNKAHHADNAWLVQGKNVLRPGPAESRLRAELPAPRPDCHRIVQLHRSRTELEDPRTFLGTEPTNFRDFAGLFLMRSGFASSRRVRGE
jgi:hypothetical protein